MNKSFTFTPTLNLNQFLSFIRLKKQYLNNLKNIRQANTKKKNNETTKYIGVLNNKISDKKAELSVYILHVKFSRSNTFLHVMDFGGKSKNFYSAGSVNYSGKRKKSRYIVFRDLYRILISTFYFLKSKPICLHLTNVGNNRFWLIKKMKKSFFIISTKVFNSYPYNGCRKSKVKRKKFKKKL
uniref:Ribosomal protein S11 n=1 Tax=Proschkinia sp. SZCZR1824 TaxID=2588390 RepID=A0A4Y5SG37_9STRA|nr:ribosomal protein S11 [Proschkinia sp. SZCZR1824]